MAVFNSVGDEEKYSGLCGPRVSWLDMSVIQGPRRIASWRLAWRASPSKKSTTPKQWSEHKQNRVSFVRKMISAQTSLEDLASVILVGDLQLGALFQTLVSLLSFQIQPLSKPVKNQSFSGAAQDHAYRLYNTQQPYLPWDSPPPLPSQESPRSCSFFFLLRLNSD